jgi:polysaccharide pyruvyl transferase WcaK-like protein
MGRVLIFGAYGNGNIGDEYQAASVARHITRCRPDFEVFATSASVRGIQFDFPAERRIDRLDAITDADFVNQFDALVIGGGGLLASMHTPLGDAAWVARLQVPIYILAVGASTDTAQRCQALILKAISVSARDDFSLNVIRHIRPDAELLHDPILMDAAILPASQAETTDGLCIIPRKMTEKNKSTYVHLQQVLQHADTVMSMFPATDKKSGWFDVFKNHEVVLATRLPDMLDAMTRHRVVVSERYHGCILALKMGIPCLGLVSSDNPESKIKNLYEQLGIAKFLVNLRRTPHDRAALLEAASAFNSSDVLGRIAELGRSFDHRLTSIMASGQQQRLAQADADQAASLTQ